MKMYLTRISKKERLSIDVILRLYASLTRIGCQILQVERHVGCGGCHLGFYSTLALDLGVEVGDGGRLADRGEHVHLVGVGGVEVLHHVGHTLGFSFAPRHISTDLSIEKLHIESFGSNDSGNFVRFPPGLRSSICLL